MPIEAACQRCHASALSSSVLLLLTATCRWTPQQLPRTPDVQIDLPTPVRNTTVSMFQTFTAGIGGTCDRFQPAAGYWCSENVEGGGAQIYFAPIAMQATTAQLPNMPYKNATGAIIQTCACCNQPLLVGGPRPSSPAHC